MLSRNLHQQIRRTCRRISLNSPASRRGFTLTEMLVVVAIVLGLAIATIPVALKMNEGRRVNDGVSTVQANLNGARDRAMSRGVPVGVRFIPDDANPEICRSMMLVRIADPISQGTARVMESDPTNAPGVFDRVVLIGANVNEFRQLPQYTDPTTGIAYYTGVTRFSRSGALYEFRSTEASLNGSGTTVFPSGNPFLTLVNPFTSVVPSGTYPYTGGGATTGERTPTQDQLDSTNASGVFTSGTGDNNIDFTGFGVDYEVPLETIPLEDAEPIQLPAGVVIDLGQLHGVDPKAIDPPESRLTRLRPNSQNNWELVISPSGQGVGIGASTRLVVIWVRDENAAVGLNSNGSTGFTAAQKQIRTTDQGNHRLLVFNTLTGLLNVVSPVFADGAANGGSGTANDGFFDFENYFDNAKDASANSGS